MDGTLSKEIEDIFHKYWKMAVVGTAIGLPLTLYLKTQHKDKPAWVVAGILTAMGFTIKTIMLK